MKGRGNLFSILSKSISYFALISCLIFVSGCNTKNNEKSIAITLEEANQLLNNYHEALATNDSNAIKLLWSQSSLARRGFWTIHNNFYPWGSFSDWKKNVNGGKFEILNLDSENDHYLLQVRWIPKDDTISQIRNLKYYVLQENKHWVFINPIDLFTRNWRTYSTDHIVFYYPPEIDIDDYVDEIRYAEQEFSKALRKFGIQLTHKIDFYKARTDVECGKLMNFGPVNGYVLMPQSTEKSFGHDIWFVASSSFVNHHEFIHVITGLLSMPFDNPAITEGMACAFAGAFHSTPDYVIDEACNQIRQSTLYPLKTLLTMDNQTFGLNNYITYSQAGSFIRFLHDRYGIGKLKNMCSMPLKGSEAIASIETNYNCKIDQLEKEWMKYLSEEKIPEIGNTISSTAQTVFSMTDDEEDDIGDGDYSYPKFGDYSTGCFDIKKFEVFKGDQKVYFRIELKKLKTPLILGDQSQAEKLVVGCIIAIQKGKGTKRHLHKLCHGVRFSGDDGYDLKVNIGTSVSIANNFGELFFSSPEIVNNISKYSINTIEFSVPIELIGEPKSDWKYFVGTCLVSNRTMSFLGEPVPVYKVPPVPIFIGGGNYDYGNPPYMDILLPPGADQSGILANYSINGGKLAIVPMVGSKEGTSNE